MTHHEFRYKFDGSNKCAICTIEFDDHNKCEFCGEAFHTAELFVQELNGSKSIICQPCIDKNVAAHLDANTAKIAADRHVNKIGIEYVPIDYSVTYRQELYNSKVATIEEVREKCPDNEAFITALTNRYEQLKDAINTNQVEQLVIAQRLRDIGALHRQEVRDKIKASDDKYQPEPVKKVSAKVKTVKASPLDRIIQTVAMAKGISIEEAAKQVRSNPAFMNLSAD